MDDVEVVEGDDEGTSWVLTQPKDLMTLAGTMLLFFFFAPLFPMPQPLPLYPGLPVPCLLPPIPGPMYHVPYSVPTKNTYSEQALEY